MRRAPRYPRRRPVTAFRSGGYSNHRHATEAFGNVDFIYVYGDTAEQVFRDAIRRTVFGVEVPVAPLTDAQYLEWVALAGGHQMPRGNTPEDEPFEL